MSAPQHCPESNSVPAFDSICNSKKIVICPESFARAVKIRNLIFDLTFYLQLSPFCVEIVIISFFSLSTAVLWSRSRTFLLEPKPVKKLFWLRGSVVAK